MLIDDEFVSRINDLFGPALSNNHIHMAAVPLLLMRAYTTIVDNRPPGNIHVGQVCKLLELPAVGSTLCAEVVCQRKELKRDRRILTFATSLTDSVSKKRLMCGESTIFWAA
ncbi:MAG: hypothetical protein ACWA5K_01010 [bacterium]